MPSSLLNILIELWPILSAITPLLFGAGFLYLRTQFPTKADFDSLAKTVNEIGDKMIITTSAVDHLAQEQESAPTRIELMNRIADLGGRVSKMEGSLDGIATQLDTTNDYLKIIVERGLGR